MISIHTSAKEVTKELEPAADCPPDFNPHFREGSDDKNGLVAYQCENFNPHFREGSDNNMGFTLSVDKGFQSTLPRRKWQICGITDRDIHGFQSTLPRRKWQVMCFCCGPAADFNPHFREGSDAAFHKIPCLPDLFQSTLPRRKWPAGDGKGTGADGFQSTLPRRKWQGTGADGIIRPDFNPHFREGSDWTTFKTFLIAVISIHTSAKEVTTRFIYFF